MSLPVNTRRGSLAINSIQLMSTRFQVLNLAELHGGGAVRGGQIVIPGQPGVKPTPRRRTAWTVDLQMLICGEDDGAGNAFADPVVGLISNLNVILNSVADPPTPPTVTRTAVWTPWQSTAKTFPVVVEEFTVGQQMNPSTCRATLSIMLPGGRP